MKPRTLSMTRRFRERGSRVTWHFAGALLLAALAACRSPSPPSAGLPTHFPGDPFSTNAMRLQEGDVIKITVEGATNLNTTERILVDGLIAMPQIGKVMAAGKRPIELEA